jgi:predicted Zn-dependent protease with MMP-like domain
VALECVEALGERWREAMPDLEFRVEEVPAADPAPWEARAAPLGKFVPGTPRRPPLVVLYRRPIETRCGDDVELSELVSLIVVENVAHALGVAPEDVDPRFG